MMALDSTGKALTERIRLPTPVPATTAAVLAEFEKIKAQMPAFDRVSVGFPGVIKHGKTFTAANLDPSWIGFPLQETLEKEWKKPVRVCNDAAVQGYAAVQGKDVELILTLGTGLGSALFTSGHLCPGLELAHHIWRKKTVPTRITWASAVTKSMARRSGISSSSKPSSRPRSSLTGTPSILAEAIPRRSRSSFRRTSKLSLTKTACSVESRCGEMRQSSRQLENAWLVKRDASTASTTGSEG